MRWLDEVEKNCGVDRGQRMVPTDECFNDLLKDISNNGRPELEAAIRTWAGEQPHRVEPVLNKAGWGLNIERTQDWYIMDAILKMPDGEEKDELLAQAMAESPRFYQQCVEDYLFCGVKVI